MTRVAFVVREPASGFVAVDRRCLSTLDLVEVSYPGRLTGRYAWDAVRTVAASDVVYAFFASEHALLPAVLAKLLGRRFVLVPGGYDYADDRVHGYGLAARGRGWLPRLLGRLCDAALPVSEQCRWEFLALVPSAAPRTRLAHLALDPDDWSDPGVDRDPDLVVTVAFLDEEAWSRKGIDRFVAAARTDPGRQYVLAGRETPAVARRLDREGPPNLERRGLADGALRRLLWSAGVYVQLSWHETFGMAMAEAMACGCLPLIDRSPALHEVAGDWAVVVHAGESDSAAIARAARKARTVDRPAMRADVASRFSVERRRRLLLAAVQGA